MSLLGNLVFFIFGGFLIFIGYVLGGILLCLTIIGYPLAVQHMKLVPNLIPFTSRLLPASLANHPELPITCRAMRFMSAVTPVSAIPDIRRNLPNLICTSLSAKRCSGH